MLVTSIFFFSHNVFEKLFPTVLQKSSLCGNGLRKEGEDQSIDELYGIQTHFQSFSSYFKAASASINAFLQFLLPTLTQSSFKIHWLDSDITSVENMISVETVNESCFTGYQQSFNPLLHRFSF